MAEYLRCKQGFMLPDRTIVKGGQIVVADDRVVKGRESLFEPAHPDVEQATKAPGERRFVTRPADDAVIAAAAPAKKAAVKKAAD